MESKLPEPSKACCYMPHSKVRMSLVFVTLALSSLNMTAFITYLVLILDARTGTDAEGPLFDVFVVFYVFVIIGALASLLQFILCIIFLKGDQSREPKWIRVYMFIGTLSLLIGNVSLLQGCFNIYIFIWTIGIAGMQIYFLIVIRKNYKKVVVDKESKAVGETPSVAKMPAEQYI